MPSVSLIGSTERRSRHERPRSEARGGRGASAGADRTHLAGLDAADDPGWPVQVIELALRGIMAEASDNRLDSDDVTRMVEPVFALAYDARRAVATRERQP